MRYEKKSKGRGGRRLPRALGLVLALAMPLAACDVDTLLEVEEPEFPGPGEIGNPELQFNTSFAEFQAAYGGTGGDAWVSVSGLITDELVSTGSFSTRTRTDRRVTRDPSSGNTYDGAFTNLHQARQAIERAIESFEEQLPNDTRRAQLLALQGYVHTVLAEGWCGHLPFSEFNFQTGEIVEVGSPLTSVQVVNRAIGLFDDALSVDAGSNLAKIGKARALLQLGDVAGAAAMVADVPTTFAAKVEFSDNSGRQNNSIFGLQANGRYSFDPGANGEGINGVPFRGAADPRVPWVFIRNGFSAGQVHLDQRYQNFAADMPFADGVEARLIEAEAALLADPDGDEWLEILNDLRADVGPLMNGLYNDYPLAVPGPNVSTTLDPLTDPGDDDARRDLLFQERALWLAHTGRRLGDLRRLTRAPYNLDSEDVFPTGAWFRGGEYGTAVAFDLPFIEIANNPNVTESACITEAGGGDFTGL